MEPVSPSPAVSKKVLWTSYVMSALSAAMLLMSAVMKFMAPPAIVQSFAHLGFLPTMTNTLGVVEMACTVVYLIPCTAVLGAILLTGYLGGAVCATYRAGDPWWAPVLLGVVLWGGLFLRDTRLRALIPFRR